MNVVYQCTDMPKGLRLFDDRKHHIFFMEALYTYSFPIIFSYPSPSELEVDRSRRECKKNYSEKIRETRGIL